MRITSETGANLSTYLAARLIFVAALLGVAMVFRRTETGLLTYLLLFAGNAALSVGGWEWYRRSKTTVVRWVALSVAVGLDTLALYYTGGADNEYVFLYFFGVASAGLLMGLGGGLWITALSIAGYVGLHHPTARGFIAEQGLHTFAYSVNFLLTALLTAYLSEKMKARERKHLQALGELEQTRLDTQAILDTLRTGVIVLDNERQVQYFNPAGLAILGLEKNAPLAEISAQFAPEQPLGNVMTEAENGSVDDQPLEVNLRVASGIRPVGLSMTTMANAQGQTRGQIILFKDLTKSKELERAEREQDRLAVVGGLARELAHEIRNPLATVRGCVEMMRMSSAATSESAAFFDLALREADRLNHLLRDFLTFARMELPRKISGNLAATIRERLAMLRQAAMVVDQLPTELFADYDPEQMSLVVDAIILTLAEWSELDEPIIVRADSHNPARLCFTMPGTCIADTVRDRAFLPFSGVQKSANGLALATAMRVMHSHGGTLTLETQNGRDTVFQLEIIPHA